MNPTPGAAMVNEPMGMNATGTSGVPPMVFVDDKGLEEQFLTEDEDSPKVLDTTANCVTTPVDTIQENQGTQQAQEEELDLQPSRTQQQTEIEKGQVQQNGHNRDLHSDLPEDLRNSLRTTLVSRKAETIQKERNVNRGIHSEFIEHSQQSLGTLNIGRSKVQATDQMNTQQIPLTGYENFRQKLP